MRNGAVLVDIREADEHAREHIPGARHHALSRIDNDTPLRPGDDVLVFHCRSGARTKRQRAEARRRGAGLRGLYPRRRHRRLEEGRPARQARPQPADRHHAPGADRGRQPDPARRRARLLLGTGLLCAVGFRRRRIAVRRRQRLLRHGAPVRADAVEPAREPRNDHSARAAVDRLRQPGRLYARPGRRRRIDPGRAAPGLRRRRAHIRMSPSAPAPSPLPPAPPPISSATRAPAR